MGEATQMTGKCPDAAVPLTEAMAQAGYEFLRDVDGDPPWEELGEKAAGTEREMAGVYLDVVRQQHEEIWRTGSGQTAKAGP
jgi:hypothetical protein